MSDSLWPHGLYSPWNSPGQNTGVVSRFLPQGNVPTQGLNPGLLHCRQILYQLSHMGSARILEWVAYPFSRGSSWLRNWTRVSCITGGFFTNWAIREAPQNQALFHRPILSLGAQLLFIFIRLFVTPWTVVCTMDVSLFKIFVYLAESGLCCSTQDLHCSTWIFHCGTRTL